MNKLPWIFSNVGVDYDDRVLPSITTEVLKAVVVSERRIFSVCVCVCVCVTQIMCGFV